MQGGDVAGAKAQQRHSADLQGGGHHFSRLARRDRSAAFVNDLDHGEFGRKMSAAPGGAVGKCGGHLRAGIGAENLSPPHRLKAPAENGEGQIGSGAPARRCRPVSDSQPARVDAVGLQTLRQAKEQRRHADDSRRAVVAHQFGESLDTARAAANAMAPIRVNPK